ncbi:MAG TPA: serine/threonine-protein kinase [Gallionella sp.]|nr:serine/threonine-protein kinase [Gallionella sp.]
MAAPAAPTHIGNYSIVEQIGVGASSNVYLAIDAATYVTVAIKQLRRACLTEAYRKLMANEVALAGKLRHKNIVRLLGADLAEKSGPCLVMEYIKGVSLDRHQHADTQLRINQVLSIVEQIANALQYIAGQGVIHRDVKPENIILMPNGQAKLTDFGCAVATGENNAMVAGSLAYMSPEQLEGLPLDERADIYSLGAVLYRLLTGKNIFEADSEFDARIAVLNYPATPIQTYRKELPSNLVAVIHRALEKDADRRYPDWTTFIREFGEVAHKIRMSDDDLDVYRGFSPSTQSVISSYLSASRQFSRSGFSRSTMLD